MNTWFLLSEKEPRDAAMNMAVDQHILKLVEAGKLNKPVLRIYGWERPTLSLGYHQQWKQCVNPEAMKRYNVDLVRRWTGGRAVLHDFNEITYSVIAPTTEPFKKRVSHNYRLIGGALEHFTNLGEDSGRAWEREETAAQVKKMRHAPCFASLSQSEIEARGKKLIGSAQKLGKDCFLQHGSIPIIHRAEILEAVTGANMEMDQYMISLTDLYQNAGRPIPDRSELANLLQQAFSLEFGVTFQDLAASGIMDNQAIEEIAQDPFRSDEWTYRK